MSKNRQTILLSGAGLVGQNLLVRLKQCSFSNLVVLDKHQVNLKILQTLHTDVVCDCVYLADNRDWQRYFDGAAMVMLQAQIGGIEYNDFVRNNIAASRNILDVAKKYKGLY